MLCSAHAHVMLAGALHMSDTFFALYANVKQLRMCCRCLCMQDAEGAANMADVAEAFGLGVLDSRPVIVQPASAYTGKGLSDGLKWLVEAVKRSPRRHLVTRRNK